MTIDNDTARATPARQQQLEQQIDELRSQRRELAIEQQEAEAERAAAAADMEEAAGRAEARRQQLRIPVDQSERRIVEAGSSLEKDRALKDWEDARGVLGLFEATVGEEAAAQRRQYADRDARVSRLMATATELDRQAGSVTDELRRLVGDDQARRAQELEAQLAGLAPLVDAHREAVGITATADLSKDYTKQADSHGTAWKRWGIALVFSIAVAIAGGLLLFHEDSVPAGKLTNGVVVEVTRNLLIIGLLVYGVRLTSLQFRVHRHLEAVARNKATALSTFNRMVVVATEPEIRNSLATVLAQAVFASEETGFVDASGDHVTLIERVAGSLPRPS
jgi:hypothetical protein